MDKTPEPATVPALLRACLTGDEAGAAVIVDNSDPLPLIFALAAWANEYGISTKNGSVENWDAALAEVQRQMSGL
ncbi:hypothetical protein [Streptomyces sp. NBC_00878]|uniref:hypothetical protein n=1 Tax=Streptomyces sp. NBC_00878 TaxID=2975854 RepID=UPI0022512A7D|nr:hypothetical protein [Streptomyces sp. NBC_00878]MCX4904599.1 hypothetical protein [Streptomyces sp. NBC_00878]